MGKQGRQMLTRIEEWFRQHDDGEFSYPDRYLPYLVIGPTEKTRRMIYATKQAFVQGFEDQRVAEQLGLVCRYGLPREQDVQWLCGVIGAREVLFLGDLDPPDLLIFAWLRAHLAPLRVTHYGLNDRLLDALRISVPDRWQIQLAPSERQALPLLAEAFPNLTDIVGPQCASILEQGRKVEIEAAVSANKSVVEVLLPALNA